MPTLSHLKIAFSVLPTTRSWAWMFPQYAKAIIDLCISSIRSTTNDPDQGSSSSEFSVPACPRTETCHSPKFEEHFGDLCPLPSKDIAHCAGLLRSLSE